MIDARPTMGGVERYTYELARLMQTCSGQDRLYLYGRKDADRYEPLPARNARRRLFRHILGSGKRILTDQLVLPLAARRVGADLIHSTNYLVPLCTQKPVVVTCHDLSLLNYFSSKKAGLMKYYERSVLLSGLRKAAHVITPSKAVAADIQQRFDLPADKISTIYPPLPSFCFEASSEKPVLERPFPQQPFFLSVGTLEPRKNLHCLLQGWLRAYSRCRIPLLLVGPYGWRQRRLIEEQLAALGGLQWLGCIDDSTLSALYRQATAVVQYSLAEGFDYPVAEALSAGTPVVASDIGVHREVMAGCGLFAPPRDHEVLADRLLEVCSWSAAQRAGFFLRARQQAGLLKQSSAVEPYLAVYKQVLARKDGGSDS